MFKTFPSFFQKNPWGNIDTEAQNYYLSNRSLWSKLYNYWIKLETQVPIWKTSFWENFSEHENNHGFQKLAFFMWFKMSYVKACLKLRQFVAVHDEISDL